MRDLREGHRLNGCASIIEGIEGDFSLSRCHAHGFKPVEQFYLLSAVKMLVEAPE